MRNEEMNQKSTHLCRNTTSTSTSSRSSCRKSFRKCDTDSYVMCPQTTMCLFTFSSTKQRKFNYVIFCGDENRSGNLIFHNVRQLVIDDDVFIFFRVSRASRDNFHFFVFFCCCWENKRKLNISFRFLWARKKLF
jgi:hypothetical protein